MAGLYHFYGAKGKGLADKNYVIPDFDMSENAIGYEQVDADGNPLPTGLYISAGKNQEQEDSVQLKIVVHNRTVNPPKFESDLKARYYFNVSEVGDDISALKEPRIDYDQEKSFTDGKNEALLSGPFKYDDNGTYYVEISWQNCDFYGSRVYQFCLGYEMDKEYNKQKWDSSNDYSYQLSEQGKTNADVSNHGDGVTSNDALVIQQVEAGIYSQKDLPLAKTSA